MTEYYNAARILSPETIGIERIALRDPHPGEIRIRLEGCGVCGSNLPVWEGRSWFQYRFEPGAPGHEGWGIVEAVGSGVEKFTVGDRVTFLSYHSFAEVDIVPQDHAVKLPVELENQPFPGEALGCAMNVFKRSNIVKGSTVAIVGIGFLGALLVELAVGADAEVVAISRRPLALERASELGASCCISMQDHWPIVERVKSLTSGRGCDCVIEATGSQWPLDLAWDLVKERGTLVIAGYHQDGLRQINMQSWNWKGLDVINAHERDPKVYISGIQAAVEAVKQGRLNPFALLTHQVSLYGLNSAFRLMRERDARFMKAWVRYA